MRGITTLIYLYKHGLLENARRAYKQGNKYNPVDTLDEFLKETNDSLTAAFVFKDTTEGSVYWHNLYHDIMRYEPSEEDLWNYEFNNMK